jgi:hypothetical protein
MSTKGEVVSRELKDALLNGTIDSLAPVIRIGGHRYVRYDKIVIHQDQINFLYQEKVMVAVTMQATINDVVTISGLEGRMKMEVL